MNPTLKLYVQHPGSVRVSGSTAPQKAAYCAYAFLEERRPNVEFVFIGAAAGQQALKAVGLLSNLFDSKWMGQFILVFRPLRFKTEIISAIPPKEVDAQVWRVHVLDLTQLSDDQKAPV